MIAIIGSQRKKGTYDAVVQFGEYLKSYGGIEFEPLFLHNYKLEFCTGCKLCFDKGEEFCPLKDDRDLLIDKMNQADGVVFASPNYAFHVSARMKNLFDRLAFIFHRPRFWGKPCAAIVAQGIFGGDKLVDYLNSSGENLGFHAVGGCVVATLEPTTEAIRKKNEQKLQKAAAVFHKALGCPAPAPSLFRLLMFRISRTKIRSMLTEESRDFRYYQDNGWFVSDYYHETSLGFPKKALGRFFDVIGERITF